MNLFEMLTQTAIADTVLLRKKDQLGDAFSVPREVDFAFESTERERADDLAEFVNGKSYGTAVVSETVNGRFGIIVLITMPVTQHLICSVSGFTTPNVENRTVSLHCANLLPLEKQSQQPFATQKAGIWLSPEVVALTRSFTQHMFHRRAFPCSTHTAGHHLHDRAPSDRTYKVAYGQIRKRKDRVAKAR
jgi:hypothetical protein